MSLFKSKPQLVHIQLFYREENQNGYDKIFIVPKEEALKMSKEEKEDLNWQIVGLSS